MGNPQKIKFENIADFLDSLPEDELRIVEMLSALIVECIPGCKEKSGYNVPFYYRHSRIVFIWPASVPWGAIDKGVALGFCRGTQLFDFDTNGKKMLGEKYLPPLEILIKTKYDNCCMKPCYWMSKRIKA